MWCEAFGKPNGAGLLGRSIDAPAGEVAGRNLSGFNFAMLEVQAVQVKRQMFLFLSGGEQAQFGPTPQDVLSVQRPFLAAQVIDFPALKAAADVLSHIAQCIHTVQQAP